MNSAGGLFPDAGRNLLLILRSPVCWAWTIVLTVIHLWVTAVGGPDGEPGLFRTFGLSREGFLAGKVWQLFSYGLLHGSWAHFGVNVLLFLGLGSKVEHMLGGRHACLVIVGGILAGGGAHLLMGSGLLAGSSGACFAILMLVITLSPQSRILPIPVSGKNIGLGVIFASSSLGLVNPDLGLPGLSRIGSIAADHGFDWCFRIGHACHLGGAIAGWLAGRWVLRPRVSLETLRRERARREGL